MVDVFSANKAIIHIWVCLAIRMCVCVWYIVYSFLEHIFRVYVFCCQIRFTTLSGVHNTRLSRRYLVFFFLVLRTINIYLKFRRMHNASVCVWWIEEEGSMWRRKT